MDLIQLLHQVIQGIFLGGYYAILATGLSLIFGVMRIINLAHGDLAVLGTYLIYWMITSLHLPLLLAVVVVIPIMLAVGWALQRSVLARSLRGGELIPLLTTFGIAIALQNLFQEGFSTDPKNLGQYAGSVATNSWHVTSQLAIPYMGLIVLAVAVGVLGGLQYVLSSTAFGREMRATAQDIDTAGLVGIPAASVYARAAAIAIATAGLAGLFLGIRSGVNPTIGPSALIFAFEAVIIGGLGSLWGTLKGGLVLGVAQATGAYLLGHKYGLDWQLLTGHLVFFAVLLYPRLRLAFSYFSRSSARKAVA